MNKPLLIIPAICSGLLSCSSVSYTQSPDGTTKVSRMDLARDVQGENLEVASMGFKYSVESQNESAAFQDLVRAGERALMAWGLAEVAKNASDNASGVETSRIANEGSTDRAALRNSAARTALKEQTKQLQITEETKQIVPLPPAP